jgi:tetratricopeptide (TPR) repeat protein
MSTHIESIGNIGTANFNFANDKPSLPSNIPLPKGFIGREVELVALRQAKTDGKTSFVLHGIGGVGKTDLALKFIEEIKADYSAHIRVDMFGLSDKPTTANDAKLEVIRMFKPDVPANLEDKDINNLYISLLNQHKTILFFDNAKDREQVEPLNNASAFVVITSRATFNVSSGFSLPVEPMSSADARNLLYKITNDEARYDGQADALAYLAGYLPMALLPLASMLADDITLEAVDLVTKYKNRKERLQLADPNRENLTVMASFDLSYERLSDELQTCWRKLAVFPADFDLEAMQAVWHIEDGKTISGELVKKHLLEFNKETKRFHLHDLANDYTYEKLISNERFETEFLHCFHFGKLLRSLNELTLPNLTIFDFEQTNIEYGFFWLADKVGDYDEFAKICEDYVGFSNEILTIRLNYRKNIYWLETGVKAAQKLGDKLWEGNSLGNLGIPYRLLGNYQQAIVYYDKALIIFKKVGNKHGEGNCLGNLGIAYDNLGNYHKAIEYYNKSLEIIRKLNNPQSEGNCLNSLGVAYFNLDNYQKAIECQEKSLTISKQFNYRQLEGKNLCNLGNSYFGLGAYQKAIECQEQSSLISEEIGDLQLKCSNLINLGTTYASLGNYQRAFDYLEQSLIITKIIGDQQSEGNTLGNLGNIYLSLGEDDKAKNYYLAALKIFEAIKSPNAETIRQSLRRLE